MYLLYYFVCVLFYFGRGLIVWVNDYLVRGKWYGHMHGNHADTILGAGRHGQPTELKHHYNNHISSSANKTQQQ